MVFKKGNNRPQSWWKFIKKRRRTIATCQCEDCTYNRTIDTLLHPGVPIRHVRENAEIHAKKHRHNLTISVTRITRLYGGTYETQPDSEAQEGPGPSDSG